MFGSLKFRKSASVTLVFLCFVALLSGCGDMLGGANKSARTSSGTWNKLGGSAQSRNTGSSTGINTTYDVGLQQCDQDRARARKVTTPCGSLFQENFEELTSSCRAKFNDLYNIDCNGLRSRLESVF